MKLLLDTCVSGDAVATLRGLGHDVEWSAGWPQDPGDEVILTIAYSQDRVLVTLDKDFGELAVLRGHRHCGIIRLVGLRIAEQGPSTAAAMRKYGPELTAGAIVTIEPSRVRLRPGDGAAE